VFPSGGRQLEHAVVNKPLKDRMQENAAFLIYDGECPFCSRYADFASLSRAFPALELISARDQRTEVTEAWQAGIDLNREMALHVDGKWYTGEQAIFRVAEAAQLKRIRNSLLRRLFGSGRYARSLYEQLVTWRLLYLRLLGRKPVSRH
jgi:predicted DCC family thiol-disulfide oxidoreductase YuxK